jgi:indolepyruvate ferredoxin oxidoreductase
VLTGVQALVRTTLDQRRLDTSRGYDTRAFVSGYQGSPLGGLDLEMGRARRFLDQAGVRFQAGLNEELAATAVAGTQLLGRVPGRRHQGVTGFWYGKNPGLDRAADAIRHANVAGVESFGGAVAWIGDDPSCKSSTLPSSCEPMCRSLSMPLLAPASVAEILEFGLHAVALSRASGLWAGLKIVADIADAATTVDLVDVSSRIPLPPQANIMRTGALVGPGVQDAEYDMLTRRLDLAIAYGHNAGLNRIIAGPQQPQLTVLAAGMSYAVLTRALADLGLGDSVLADLGIRLVKIGMPFPLADEDIIALTSGSHRVLVIEDKAAFLETRVKEALYRRPDAPVVIGRRDENGQRLLTARGSLGAEDIAKALVAQIGLERLPHTAAPRLQAMQPKPVRRSLPMLAQRTPYFCSGCPHNTSTRASDDTLVGAGIGCHVMIALDGAGRGKQIGLTQMGGEGAQWFGLAPFTDDRHFVQNLGDGTFHHSGSLAIRAAVAAGVSITYKILYNDAVAMTGGQRAEGRLDIPDLTRSLGAEGVKKIVITTDDPASYRGVALHPIASVRHRDDFTKTEQHLAALEGVTVLIHDDRCAAEERRLRKRGQLPTPTERVVINERVCEGCGDCGEASTCLSVQPVETQYGRKTRIHQASCNSDLSCLKGDCPSFLLVEPGTLKPRPVPDLPATLKDPTRRFEGDVLVRMPGIGGTGVVTVSQILQMAAHLDERCAAGLEQTGLAQKGGPVVSDLRISTRPIDGAVKASPASLDVLLGFDLLGAAADSNLAVVRPGHTVAVINTALVPTAEMVTGRLALPSSPAGALERIESAADTGANLYLDAQGLSETLFADHLPANMILVGAAFQHGCLPLSAEAIEAAITLNGTAVETNLAAFRWGRAAVLDPEAVRNAVTEPSTPDVEQSEAANDLSELLTTRAADLVGYQNPLYARRYRNDVDQVAALARARVGHEGGTAIAIGYAKGLHKLMAYKDEYEVARLHLDPVEKASREREYGKDAKVSVLLHPPALRALGMQRKIRLQRTAGPVFRVLRAARVLRGTPLDPFGYAKVRRVERQLITEYRDLVRDALTHLTSANIPAVVGIATLPDLVRGYEDIKLARVQEYRSKAHRALSEIRLADVN